MAISVEKSIVSNVKCIEAKVDTLCKEKTPMEKELYLELDESPVLNEDDHCQYYSLVGVALQVAILCRIDILFSTIQLAKFQAAPRRGHLKAAYCAQGYLKSNSCFSILIGISTLSFAPNTTTVDRILFNHVCPNVVQQKASGFAWENAKSGLCVGACIDSTLNVDKRNSHSSTGYCAMVGNTLVVEKSFAQDSVEKSTYSGKFVLCS